MQDQMFMCTRSLFEERHFVESSFLPAKTSENELVVVIPGELGMLLSPSKNSKPVGGLVEPDIYLFSESWSNQVPRLNRKSVKFLQDEGIDFAEVDGQKYSVGITNCISSDKLISHKNFGVRSVIQFANTEIIGIEIGNGIFVVNFPGNSFFEAGLRKSKKTRQQLKKRYRTGITALLYPAEAE